MAAETPAPQPDRPLKGENFDAFVVWKEYEGIAIHFNELIIKLRFQALAGVAGLSASVGLLAERFGSDGRFPSGIAALAFGVLALLWIALFFLDYFYYHRLLLGAVAEIVNVEGETDHSSKIGKLRFSKTVKDEVEAPLSIRGRGTKWERTQRGPLVFYGLVLVCLLGLLVASLIAYFQPPSPAVPCASDNNPPCQPTNSTQAHASPEPPAGNPQQPPADTVDASEVIVQWDALKQKSGPSSVAMIVERGARALAPLFEKAGIPAQRALELGRIFFEHLASSASDEVGKRAVDAVFDPFSNADAPQGGPNVDSASRSRRIFSLQTAAVRFDLDRAVLPPSGQGTVQRLLELVPTRNALWLLIGSTDRTGSEARNTRLANERTAAVADYLIRSEIPRQLIIRKAIPELVAPIPGYDGALDPENRKTEITVLIVNRG